MSVKYSPNVVVWEITWKCNAKCIHCGSDCISVEKQNQLSTGECLDVIEDLSKIGAKRIILSGGDPLLREDFPTLAYAIKSKGMRVAFITNAIALDEEKINIIKNIQPSTVGISIDAADEWMHDYIRGHKGCYNNAIESLIKLKNVGIEPAVITTTHKLNFTQLPKLREILTVMGIKVWQIQYADFIGRMKQETMITEAQFQKQAEFILETKKLVKDKMLVTGADVTGYMSELSNDIGMKHWKGCHAGITVLGLGSDGTVRGCLSQQLDKFIEGNTRERSLYDIWNDPSAFAYNRCFDKTQLGGFCSECKYGEICKGGCTRAASKSSDCRCSKFCLYKFEKVGFSNEYEARTSFSKDEIAELYNPTKPLPQEFYDTYDECDIVNAPIKEKVAK